MAERFPNNNNEYQDVSQDNKDIVEEQGNLEAHEIPRITDTIQCTSFLQLRNSLFLGASDEVKIQVRENVINCSKAPICITRRVIITNVRLTHRQCKKHSRAISERRPVSHRSSVRMCNRRKSEKMGSC